MNELIREMALIRGKETEPGEITRCLVCLQNELNRHFMMANRQDLNSFLSSLWAFLLYAGSHSNTSVRLSAYRTTGVFLLRVTPYFPGEVQSTFSDMATASTLSQDIKSSAIIASSFAFVSNFNAFPYLDGFLHKNPVFHHFSIGDAIFSDHLASIIRNLGRLGIEWLTGLLHSFLQKLEHSSDRYLILAIAAVIKHDPLKLMSELLLFVREQYDVKDHLALISFLLSSIECNFDSLNLLDIAEASMGVLANFESETVANVDSAFQILGLQSPSFSVVITNANESTLRIALVSPQGEEKMEVLLNIEPCISKPSFYLLLLPKELLFPKENDGVLQLTAKFKTVSRIVNNPLTEVPLLHEIVMQFKAFLSREYSDMTSACMQGFASCLPAIFRRYEKRQLIFHILALCIFVKPKSWYHATDIVRVIKAIPVEFLKKEVKTAKVLDKLLEFVLSKNEKLQAGAKKCLVRMVINTDFYRYTHQIANMIDYYETHSLIVYLDILTMIISSSKNKSIVHLNHVVLAVLEFMSFCTPDVDLLTVMMRFLSCFDLGFVPTQELQPCMLLATSVISASLVLSTGDHWETGLKLPMEEEITEMISNHMASMNYDIISETAMDYTKFLGPFAAALKLLAALPCKMLGRHFTKSLFEKTVNLFPLESAKLIHKHWDTFRDSEKVAILLQVWPTLRYVQNYEPAAVWCALLMTIRRKQYMQRLSKCRDTLHEIARWAINHGEFIHIFFAFELLESMDIRTIKTDIENLSENQRKELKEYVDMFFPGLWGRYDSEDGAFLNDLPSSSSVEVFEEESPRGTEEGQHHSESEDFKPADSPREDPDVKANPDVVDSNNMESDLEGNRQLEDAQPQDENPDDELPVPSNEEQEEAEKKTPPRRRSLYRKKRMVSTPEITVQIFDQNISHGLATFVTTVSDDELTSEAMKVRLIDDDIASPVIKTQLRYKTYDFTPDDLQKLLLYYSGRGDPNGINAVIRYCFSKKVQISVLDAIFPTETLPLVIKYLKLIGSPELDEFLTTTVNCEKDQNVELTLRFIDRDGYLLGLLNSERVKKREMVSLCQSLPILKFDQQSLIKLATKVFELDDDATKSRVSTVVALVTAIIHSCSSLPTAFAATLLIRINEHIDTIYDEQLARCVTALTAKTDFTEGMKLFVTTCMSRIPEGLPMNLLYRQILIMRSALVVTGEQPATVTSYFESPYPSFFAGGARYLCYAVSTLKDQQAASFLKQNLKILMANYAQFSKLPAVSDAVGLPLAYILSATTRESLRRYQMSIVKHCKEVIPEHENASFSSFALCLQRMMGLMNDQTEQLRYLCAIGDSLITAPLSYYLFRTYIATLRERMERTKTPAEKENYLMDNLSSWLKKSQVCDCYKLTDVIYEWEMLVYQNLGLDYLISIVWLQMRKLVKRFFPLFTAMNRFINTNATSLTSEERSSIDVRLNGFALMDTTRAHSLAFLLCGKKEYAQEMLALAMFESDCPESEAIISRNPAFEAMLADVH